MNWFSRLFSTDRAFVGDFVETAVALQELAASNQIVQAEVEQFLERVASLSDRPLMQAEAVKSANALSGYGISVKPVAFVGLV